MYGINDNIISTMLGTALILIIYLVMQLLLTLTGDLLYATVVFILVAICSYILGRVIFHD